MPEKIVNRIRTKFRALTTTAVSEAAPIVKKEAKKIVNESTNALTCNIISAVKVGVGIFFMARALKVSPSTLVKATETVSTALPDGARDIFIIYNETNNYYYKEDFTNGKN